jgi:hypothetical protein
MLISEIAGMVKIKIEIVGGDKAVPEKGVGWRIPLKWLNPFRFKHKIQPDPEASNEEKGEENERPEGWVHPPFP